MIWKLVAVSLVALVIGAGIGYAAHQPSHPTSRIEAAITFCQAIKQAKTKVWGYRLQTKADVYWCAFREAKNPA